MTEVVDGPDRPWEEISRFGRKVVAAGLTGSRFGNISIRSGSQILITSTGSMLDELGPEDVIAVDLAGPCPRDVIASTETCVHRAAYQSGSFSAIIHTHSPYAVALSLLEKDFIRPVDGEGLYFLGPMPIVAGGFGTAELAKNVSFALANHRACVARGHGVFASGSSLAEAYTAASMAEHSSQVSYLVELWRRAGRL